MSTQLIMLLAGGALATAGVLRLLTRSLTRKSLRSTIKLPALKPAPVGPEEAGPVAVASLAAQVLADLAASNWARLCSRAAALKPVALSKRQACLDAQRSLKAEEAGWAEAKAEAESDPRPFLSPRAMNAINAALLVGDLAIVSGAITAAESGTTMLLALLSSIALALTPWSLGKTWADIAKGKDGSAELSRKAWLVGVLVVAVLFSTCLWLLREHVTVTWVGLALGPAIAAAMLGMLGPTRAQVDADRAKARCRKRARMVKRRSASAARVVGRHNGIVAKANSLALRSAAQVLSIQAHQPSDESQSLALVAKVAEFELWTEPIDVADVNELLEVEDNVDSSAENPDPVDGNSDGETAPVERVIIPDDVGPTNLDEAIEQVLNEKRSNGASESAESGASL